MRLKNVIHASTYIRGYTMLTLYIADAERDAGMKNLSRKEALEILNGMKVKIKIPKAAVMQNKRNAALDMAIEALKYSEIKLRTEKLPSAQPEIIRCKDCDWWTKQEDSVQGRCELMQMYPAGGWYCGNARRRTE